MQPKQPKNLINQVRESINFTHSVLFNHVIAHAREALELSRLQEHTEHLKHQEKIKVTLASFPDIQTSREFGNETTLLHLMHLFYNNNNNCNQLDHSYVYSR